MTPAEIAAFLPNAEPQTGPRRPCPHCGKMAGFRDEKLVNKLRDGTVVEHMCVRGSL